MAIVSALIRAKSYLILPSNSGIVDKVNNAEAPATREFQRKFRDYLDVKKVPDSFDSVSVEDLGNDYIKVTLDHSIIKRLRNGYELSSETEGYEGFYYVESLDADNDTIIIQAEYVEGVTITFDNEELQIFNDALGWYICAFTTFTLQELKINNVMITASQIGEGSMNAYDVSSIDTFRNKLKENGDKILLSKYFPAP